MSNPQSDTVTQCVEQNELRITFVNHATVLVQTCGSNILTDPVFSNRVSPVKFAGPKRFRPAGLTIEALPTIDAILISHTHYDHLDLASLKALYQRDQPKIIAPLKTSQIIDRAVGCQTGELNWWDIADLSGDVCVTSVPARHWTSRRLGDVNQCLWCGFVINTPSGDVYFAGDTGYGDGQLFREIASQFINIRCALLPIGAYEPRWFLSDQHMNPDDAALAFLDLNAKYALGIHHGTFKLTDEGHDQPIIDLQAALHHRGISADRFITLPNGGGWSVPGR